MLVVDDAISPYLVTRTVQQLTRYKPMCDVYDNPFESKLQLPKQFHSEYPFSDVINYMYNPCTIALLEQLFEVKLSRSDWDMDYFCGFFIYRTGDFLQYHLDSTYHDGSLRVLTANLYLTECKGGLFVHTKYKIVPRAGQLIVFENNGTSYHGVTQVQGGERMVLSFGYLGTPEQHPHLRKQDHAKFVPWPDEAWTQEQFTRAEMRLQK